MVKICSGRGENIFCLGRGKGGGTFFQNKENLTFIEQKFQKREKREISKKYFGFFFTFLDSAGRE